MKKKYASLETLQIFKENTDKLYATQEQLNNKSDADHTHNDIYYTETEINEQITTINNSISTSLNEAKSYSDTNLNAAKTYTDNAVAQKTQVQIITWEADD